MAKPRNSSSWNEVTALILLGLGTLLFLALISYTPRDLPTWIPFSEVSTPNDPTQNFIGPIGAVAAGLTYFLLGAASFLIAVVLVGYGGAKLLSPAIRVFPRTLWVGLFIVSGASLAQIQSWFLQDWRGELAFKGPGGWVGYVFGEQLLANYLGNLGAIILLGVLYLAALIQMTGLRPVQVLRQSVAASRKAWAAYEQRRLEKADERRKLELEEKRLARERRKLEKELGRKGVPLPDEEAASPDVVASAPDNLPEPKIIDASGPLPPEKRRGKGKAAGDEELQVASQNVHFADYKLPDLDILSEPSMGQRKAADPDELRGIQNILIETLNHFGVAATPGDITRGPTITRYEIYPARGIRVDRIVSLERDLARATRAEKINILAPIPGKDTVGIEIANSNKVVVAMKELLETDAWNDSKAKIPLALGKDVYGKTMVGDLAAMPHLLVAGTTGSGKSVCINTLVASMLFRFTPEELRFIMIDPKVVEMQNFNRLPHLVVPVVTDSKKVLLALRWVIQEMEKRYRLFAERGVRNITGYNALIKKETETAAAPPQPAEAPAGEETDSPDLSENGESSDPIDSKAEEVSPLPFIVVIIDELADLMQTAPADVESAIARITQMARAAGIHMIVATQTPRADVITGVIKANIPSRIAFQVASKLDSRVILDANGADRLLGQGDMLYLPPGTSRLVRVQGALVTDEEMQKLVDFAAAQAEPVFDAEVQDRLESSGEMDEEISDEDEELLEKCMEIIRQEKKASTSLLQRRLRLGYTRAARMVDILEKRGIVGPGEGAKPREILVDLDVGNPELDPAP